MKAFSLLALVVLQVSWAVALPTNFDARTQWTGCAFFILNQQQCGSCWDFCSVESFADRLCITGEAPSGTIISPEPILECSRQGCDGGYPSTAWNWMINNGDTTCTNQCRGGCAPYDSGSGTSPSCHKGTCDSGSAWSKTYYAGSYQSLTGGISQYQTELYNHGPLQACFTVYNNFYTFFDAHPTGIYQSASGGVVGGHCVKLIGWGVSNGINYWTFANSWDTTWGDSGYFKMQRGINLCGIESSISEGFTPKQSAARAQYGLINVTNTFVGGWHAQDEESDLLDEVVKEAVAQVSKVSGETIELEKVVSVETQVVAGVNSRAVLMVNGGKVLRVRLFRNLNFEYELVNFEMK
jgi:cathepsin B